MMDKIRVGVIGIGHLGSIHSRIYSELKGIELAGVADIDKNKAKKSARKCKTRWFTDYKDLFGKVDAVSVVVPTELHHKVTSDFLNNGVNVLVEKPITTTVQQADEILSLAESKGLILQVGHVERFNAAVKAIQSLAHKPRFIECHRLGPFKHRGTDVGVVLDLMIHDIDIILGFVKSNLKRCDAIGVKVLTPHEDIANARLVFEDGTVCDLTASRLTPEAMRKIRIFVEDAYISIDYLKQQGHIYRKQGKKITFEKVNIKKEEPLKKELSSFVNCVRTKEKPLVSGQEGRQALKVALDIINLIHK